MKIGILTLPFHSNYGGILQAYALQTVLKGMGHDVKIIRRNLPYRSLKFPNNLVLDIKYCLRILLRGKSETMNSHQIRLVTRNTSQFINKYMQLTEEFYTDQQLRKHIAKNDYDAYVVGSDQVWKPTMPNIYNYFFDFLTDEKAKRMAYAASFGVDFWEYNDEQTATCSQLAKKFDAISVRESSGVDLCVKYLGVDATHVLDPTLLLDAERYEQLAIAEKEPNREGELFCYVLDTTEKTRSFVDIIKKSTGYSCYYCMPEKNVTPGEISKNADKCVYPPVTRWIRSFMDARMVFTDSFHGTVFSIIFNKPFWVLGNEKRGMARFESLLNQFGLYKRLVTPEELNNIDWNEPIEWEEVNDRLKILQKHSVSFLKKYCSNES